MRSVFSCSLLLCSAFLGAMDGNLFDVAKAHRVLKNYPQAIELYKSRLDAGGDKKEQWLAKYMLAECYEEQSDWDRALYWYLEAFQEKPDYVIPLKKLATHYRLLGKNEVAYLFAKQASRTRFPEGQSILSAPPVYSYQIDEELCIAAYYTRNKDEGFDAADRLIFSKHSPWSLKNQTYINLQFYVKQLPQASYLPIELDLPLIYPGSEERYHPMNPSIRKTTDGYEVVCRTVNYTQTDAKYFNTIDPTGIFRTRNFLLRYDSAFHLLSQKEIVENLPRERIKAFNVSGLDDCRVFEFNNSSWFTCTTSDTNPYNFQVSLCKLAESSQESTVEVEKLVPLIGPDPHRCEKNWLPFTHNGELFLIYSCGPLVVYKPNIDTGVCQPVVTTDSPCDFSTFRGSASPVPFDDGFLLVVHEVAQLPDYERRYYHRFVYLDNDFHVTRISKPFIFHHLGIEFCCGMVVDHQEQNLVISLGVEDEAAYLCFVALNTVRSLLEPLPYKTAL